MFDHLARVAVKVCGLTNRKDAFAAVELGADALGFNTWTGTKRFIDLNLARPWMEELPSHVFKVALFVNSDPSFIRRVADYPFIDAIQLHGDEDALTCAKVAAFGKPLIKAVRVKDTSTLEGLDQFSTEHLLLDAHVPGAFGGTGHHADLRLVQEFQVRYPKLKLWLAGGLSPRNLGGILKEVQPQVVDVSSGVEVSPGLKDFEKMRAFITTARNP